MNKYLLIVIIFILIKSLYDTIYNSKYINTQLKENFQNKDKIAFCFLTIGDIKQKNIWINFFSGNMDRCNIYVHPKFKEEVSPFFKRFIINKLIPTSWGHVSLVDATNLMIKNALKDTNNKKIILVSDSCIPIKNFDYIYNEVLNDDKSWFNYYRPNKLQGSKEHLRRIKLLDQSLKKNAHINEQWMVLDRKHAELLNSNIGLMKYFRIPRLIPDEIYYITVLHHLNKNIKNELKYGIRNRQNYLRHEYVTFAKWFDEQTKKWQIKHPIEFNRMRVQDVNKMKYSKALFARKFSKSSNIEKYWNYIVSNK